MTALDSVEIVATDSVATWAANMADTPIAPARPPAHRWLIALDLLVTGAMAALGGAMNALGWLLSGRWTEPYTGSWVSVMGVAYTGALWGLPLAMLGAASVVAATRYLQGRGWQPAVACLVTWSAISLVLGDGPIDLKLLPALLLVIAAGSIAYGGRYGGHAPATRIAPDDPSSAASA